MMSSTTNNQSETSYRMHCGFIGPRLRAFTAQPRCSHTPAAPVPNTGRTSIHRRDCPLDGDWSARIEVVINHQDGCHRPSDTIWIKNMAQYLADAITYASANDEPLQGHPMQERIHDNMTCAIRRCHKRWNRYARRRRQPLDGQITITLTRCTKAPRAVNSAPLAHIQTIGCRRNEGAAKLKKCAESVLYTRKYYTRTAGEETRHVL